MQAQVAISRTGKAVKNRAMGSARFDRLMLANYHCVHLRRQNPPPALQPPLAQPLRLHTQHRMQVVAHHREGVHGDRKTLREQAQSILNPLAAMMSAGAASMAGRLPRPTGSPANDRFLVLATS